MHSISSCSPFKLPKLKYAVCYFLTICRQLIIDFLQKYSCGSWSNRSAAFHNKLASTETNSVRSANTNASNRLLKINSLLKRNSLMCMASEEMDNFSGVTYKTHNGNSVNGINNIANDGSDCTNVRTRDDVADIGITGEKRNSKAYALRRAFNTSKECQETINSANFFSSRPGINLGSKIIFRSSENGTSSTRVNLSNSIQRCDYGRHSLKLNAGKKYLLTFMKHANFILFRADALLKNLHTNFYQRSGHFKRLKFIVRPPCKLIFFIIRVFSLHFFIMQHYFQSLNLIAFEHFT